MIIKVLIILLCLFCFYLVGDLNEWELKICVLYGLMIIAAILLVLLYPIFGQR